MIRLSYLLLLILTCSLLKTYAIQDGEKPAMKVAQRITHKEMSDEEKVAAIYDYLTTHIKYDVKTYQKGEHRNQTPPETLKRKKGVCSHYSELFDFIAKEVKLNSHIVIGISNGLGHFPGKEYLRADHAWNAVEINGKWFLLDATWGAGSVERRKQPINKALYTLLKIPYNRNKYKFKKNPTTAWLKTDPKVFIETHLPNDPRWQLLNPIIPIEEYQDGPKAIESFFKDPYGEKFDFTDSIIAFKETKYENRLLKEGYANARYNYKNNDFTGLMEMYYGYSQIQNSRNLRGSNNETRLYFLDNARGHLLEAQYYLKEDQKTIKDYHNKLKTQFKERSDEQLGNLKDYYNQNNNRLEKNKKYLLKAKERNKEFIQKQKDLQESMDKVLVEDKLSRVKAKTQADPTSMKVIQIEYAIDSLNLLISNALQQNDSLFKNSNQHLNKELNTSRARINRIALTSDTTLLPFKSSIEKASLKEMELENKIFAQIKLEQEEKLELLNTTYNHRKQIDDFNNRHLKGNYKFIRKHIKENRNNYKFLIQMGQDKEDLLKKYQEDKDTLIASMSFMHKVYGDYITSNKRNFPAIKLEKKVLKKENKTLKKTIEARTIYDEITKADEKIRYTHEKKANNRNLVQSKKFLKLADKSIAKLKRIMKEEAKRAKSGN